MTRTISGALLTSFQGPAAETCALIELQLGSGTQRLTTGGQTISWNGQTWTAIGGALQLEPMSETIDNRGNGVGIQLSGVDQAILALLLGETFVGRKALIYWAHLDVALGTVIGTPLLIFDGLMLEGWTVEEVRSTEESPGTVTIRSRLAGRYSELLKRRGVRCNEHDHQLAIGAAAAGDTFFQNVPKLVGESFIWGKIVFTPPGGGAGGTPRPPNPTPWGGPGSGGTPWGL